MEPNWEHLVQLAECRPCILMTIFYLSSLNSVAIWKKFKQGWSTIQTISTERTIIYHNNPLNAKNRPHHIIMGSQTLHSWWLDLQRQYIYKQTIKNLHRLASSFHMQILKKYKVLRWSLLFLFGSVSICSQNF